MEQKLKERPCRDFLPGDATPPEKPNPNKIAVAQKCLLTRACYCCPLRGSARAGPIQMQMYTAKHWSEYGNSNGEVRARTVGAEGVCNLIGRTTISTNQTHLSSQVLNIHPKSTQDMYQRMALSGIPGMGAPWCYGGLMTQDRETLGC